MLAIKKNKGANNVILNVLRYMLVSSIVLSNTVWVRSNEIPIDQGILTLVFLISSFLLCLLFWINNGRRIKRSLVIIELLVMTVTFGSGVVLKQKLLTYLIYYALPLLICVMYLGLENNVNELWKSFSNVVAMLCLISLFFYVFGSMLKVLPATGVTEYEWTWDCQCSNWYNLYYEAYYGRSSILSFLPRKNTGLYTEPPMFMIMVCTAMAGELSFVERPRKKKLILFVLSLITIMSTTGFLFLIISIVIYILTTERGKRYLKLKIMIFPLIVLIGVVAVLELLYQKIGTVFGESSVNIRFDHLLTSLRLWGENPLFGIGYGQSDLFEQASRYRQGASVGLPLLLAYSGIWGSSLYFIPLIRAVYVSIKDNQRYLYFILGTFLLLLLTSVNYLPIMIFITAIQIVCIQKPKRIV